MADTEETKTNQNREANSSPVVTREWLYQQVKGQDAASVVIVDCRFSLADPDLGRQQYEQSHIPGAYYLDLNQDLSSPVQQHGGRHPLPDPVQLADKLSAIGVRSGPEPTLVVAYDDSRLAFAARLWWLLRYLGHDRVAVLDGGFSGWQAAGYPVTADLPQPQPGHFVPQIQADWTVNIETVKTYKDLLNVVLIDSREAERYRGEREPIDPVAGHIPGAVNYPWPEVTDEQGFIRPLAQQQQRWANLGAEVGAEVSVAEAPTPAELIVYCGSGVTACVNLLALEIAGISYAKLYPGSWSDWCSYL
ncbi:MAG: sulfurtransferase [Leptolyngbya sp. IPPAS B-1204]|nr:MAG: sulfurtransferase [Leptolyngbya sp. IPPAS B-1204]